VHAKTKMKTFTINTHQPVSTSQMTTDLRTYINIHQNTL